uniref:Pentatricopeptide repeat-containing protein n=1 Tax=Fagus sylvatica TaxID=28930 RepID=A0A2N9ERB7_FAGSY
MPHSSQPLLLTETTLSSPRSNPSLWTPRRYLPCKPTRPGLRFVFLEKLELCTILYCSNDSSPLPWNIVIRGYASSDSPRRGEYEEGRQVHGDVVKCGLDSDVYVQNSLISAYGCCRRILDACRVFDEMSVRTIVSWNAVITACVENMGLDNGMGYFVKMRDAGFEPDETTMVVMLSACVGLGNLSLGRWVHSLVIVRGMVLNLQLGTALVDIAMILGLAQHGFANEALDLFHKMMKNSSIRPNYVTFLGALCACSHAGLVNDGYKYFHDMEHVHRIKPLMIHYGAMVDILGRAGQLKEAYAFIMHMPMEPDPIVWRTLLSACSIHDVNDNDGVGDKKAADVRKIMKAGRLKKMAGESSVSLGGSIHRFFSGYDAEADCDDCGKWNCTTSDFP